MVPGYSDTSDMQDTYLMHQPCVMQPDASHAIDGGQDRGLMMHHASCGQDGGLMMHHVSCRAGSILIT